MQNRPTDATSSRHDGPCDQMHSTVMKALLRKSLILCQDTGASLVLYFAAKYASPSLAEDVKMVIGLLQLPVTAIIVAISMEDSVAMKARMFLKHATNEK